MDIPLLSSLTSTTTAALLLSVFTAFYAIRLLTRPRLHLPPGPRPLPFIGNVLDIPSIHPEERFSEWGDKYGDVVHIHIFGQPMLVLNSLQATRDLMDKRSAIYSDRPRFVLFSELMGWQAASTHVRYGARFRKHRRFIQQTFNQRAIATLRPLQEQETLIFLQGLTQSPKSYVDHLRRYAAATILKITYGHKVTSVDDLFVRLAERAGTLTVESGSPAATLVDFFPIMKHIPTWAPFSTFKRNAQETKRAVDSMMNIPFNIVKDEMKAGIATPSFTSTLLEACRKPGQGSVAPEDEADIRGAAGTLYVAAEDTTVCVLETWFLAMTLYPEVFRKLQEEMDEVTRGERLPRFDDSPSLPYLECVIKEVVRWNPPVPLGMPHRLMEDDVYRGYHLPKGSTVIANIFGILKDVPDPDTFRPERYLEDPELMDPRTVIFGFGRRICPGRYFAETSVWSVMANVIATFDIKPAVDEKGEPVRPKVEFTTGFVRHPHHFACNISPRSERSTKLVHAVSAGQI
ncbi:cytochrome P450 [Pluteus cervinus]|uniref:Cytochrome P450 n=1 Tax=Pluteus cervinus TaxID=181527 RepID=A0ACD3AR36_9AGAR|nr:cytochrome P450 [Pluteus cervinus]